MLRTCIPSHPIVAEIRILTIGAKQEGMRAKREQGMEMEGPRRDETEGRWGRERVINRYLQYVGG